MRLEQLQAFLAIAESGSFQKAAYKCSVTQSTISRQIQALEADLGFELFHRTAQSKLTLAGETLLPRARKICVEWQTVKQEITDLIAGKQSELCIACIPSVCAYYFPPLLQLFCKEYPDVQLRVTSLGSDRALKVLKDGLVDLAIVMNNRFLTTSKEMVVETLYEEPIEVLISVNHPLAEYECIPWGELIRYRQVIFKEGYGMQRLVQSQFDQTQTLLKSALEVNTLDAFRGIVRQGELIALLPSSALIEARTDPSLAIRPFVINNNGSTVHSTSLTRQVVIVTTQDRLQIPPIQHFWHLVTQEIPKQINSKQ
ncbi:LysR family transcriptional regulator [Calothrix sp. CCY 0018]|uniref:LysR family transcriptional regulator n=1 Tax=Calothrix sp. CCY 0018 TaxID=3103864 RepID=UPI0039C61754